MTAARALGEGTTDEVLRGDAAWCIVHGDAPHVFRDLPDGCIDAFVTDPPLHERSRVGRYEAEARPIGLGRRVALTAAPSSRRARSQAFGSASHAHDCRKRKQLLVSDDWNAPLRDSWTHERPDRCQMGELAGRSTNARRLREAFRDRADLYSEPLTATPDGDSGRRHEGRSDAAAASHIAQFCPSLSS